MKEVRLNTNGDFVVKESVGSNIFIGVVFLLLALAALINFTDDTDKYHPPRTSFFVTILAITLPPAILFIAKGFMHQTVMTINKNGIYYFGTLKTNWNNFINAYITQDEIPGSIQDNFVLILQFYKEGKEGFFETKIPLRNTQDKSEEEIIAAIKYFNSPSEVIQ